MGNHRTAPDRIVACCYCGARSLLPAQKRPRRLVCHGCGAPIRRIEALATPGRRAAPRPLRGRRIKPAIPHRAEHPGQHLAKDRPARRRKGRRRGLGYHLREIFDELEDFFEDLFD